MLARKCGAILRSCAREALQRRGIVFKMANATPPRVVGYFVLFPDIPNECAENNAFLASIAQNADWPALTASPKEIYEGTVRLMMEYGASVVERTEQMAQDKGVEMTFDSVVKPLLDEEYAIDYAFNAAQVKMMTDWPECPFHAFFDDIYHLRVLAAREHSEKLMNEEFQKALRSIYDNQYDETGERKLDIWQRRLIEWCLLEMRACGLDVSDDEKKRKLITSWGGYIDKYRNEYINNIVTTNDQNQFNVASRELLADAPPHVLKSLARGNDPETGPYKVVMEPKSIYQLLRYCRDRQLRANAWDCWISKASFEHDVRNNSVVIEEIRHNNEGFVKVLGYSSVAEHRLANKMAGSPETVRTFLDELIKRMRPVFMDRVAAWQSYAASNGGTNKDVQPSDLFYLCRHEAEHHYGIRCLDLMKHFPFWPTFNNIVQILSHLLDIDFKDVTEECPERCHPSVRVFSVSDKGSGEHLGRLYVDAFQRDHKRCDWNSLLVRLRNKERGLDTLVFLLGSANEPDGKGESYLYHTQLQSLLFNIGRSVQYLLSASPYRDIVIPQEPRYAADWDAADLFPVFMQLFVYKPNMLKAMASPHAESGVDLSGYADAAALALARSTLWDSYRTLFWADFDLSIFEMEDRRKKFWFDLYREMLVEYFPFPRERRNYHPSSFLPIFGQPAMMAMYYRKLWAEMLALDVHETFYRECDERATGDRLKEVILRMGSGEPQAELYRRFQGRDPSVGAICDFYDPPPMEIEGGEAAF